jgi:SAM-dependent methyltransferase
MNGLKPQPFDKMVLIIKMMKATVQLSILLFLTLTCSMTVIAQKKDSVQLVPEGYRKAWNETLIYGDVFKREHSISLAKAIQDIPPGKALDVAMGEGRNTLFLARHGWETTGFDIADVALDSVRSRAARENLDVEIITASRETFDFGIEKWDLIAVLYADAICGRCCADDDELISTIKNALKPGGRVVYEGPTRQGLIDMEPEAANTPYGCKNNAIKDAFLKTGKFEIIHYSEEIGIADWDPSGRFEPAEMIYMIAEKVK